VKNTKGAQKNLLAFYPAFCGIVKLTPLCGKSNKKGAKINRFYPAFCRIVKSVPALREQQKEGCKNKTVHGSAVKRKKQKEKGAQKINRQRRVDQKRKPSRSAGAANKKGTYFPAMRATNQK
jgi:hypothetical protein